MCYYEIQILGKFQSWPNGTDCKSVSLAFSGSNPLFPTNLRVQLSGRAPAFQAGCEGPIPFTRSNMRLQLSWIEQRTSNPCVRGSTPLRRANIFIKILSGISSVGQSDWLRTSRPGVRILNAAPEILDLQFCQRSFLLLFYFFPIYFHLFLYTLIDFL